ncbi:MAG TPA: hopanoid biosynthesis-associated protein HpnK [Acidocella sp.]|jgi:hopanoid biosynthesis associated protein HpnK|uniref:hopanoid biosynthesis-associated protein HpnK n=1 Tax=Acidocella sp. TaxID=50710 RepID=UPI002CEE36F7|nr:hopanoid biosynthesis-associated protein HpnK [Acidocella sp.]HVE20851.1 hopanoid biosynthesis-associated protein HpnK [Acidocella sp.]
MNPIFSADDFGLTVSVNEAVERAHMDGVLGQASLMVAAPAAADAVRRAKALPALKTGLHLVLVDGDSCLGHFHLPTITGPDGRFSADQASLGVKYFFSPAARRELRAEIHAQFAAYAATGLEMHHADAHKHMHLHPTVARLMIEIGREYGCKRIRVPAESPAIMALCGEKITAGDRALYAWSRVLRAQAKQAGLAATDHVFGLKWSGHMTEDKIRLLLRHLPEGSAEIYFHPATYRDDALVRLMPGYEHEAELKTLLALRRE